MATSRIGQLLIKMPLQMCSVSDSESKIMMDELNNSISMFINIFYLS